MTISNSAALDVALNIGLLTKDKLKFTSIKLGLKGERSVAKNLQKFKLFDLKTKQVIFSLIMADSSIRVVEFRRGPWEELFEQYVQSKKGNSEEPRLRLRRRTKESQDRTKG